MRSSVETRERSKHPARARDLDVTSRGAVDTDARLIICMATQMSKRPGAALLACATKLPLFFRALCDPNRVSLLAWLASQRRLCTVSEIAEGGACPVDLSVVSRHLHTLREAGILESERRGREVLYRVRVDALVSTLRGLADALEACCPPTAMKKEPPP